MASMRQSTWWSGNSAICADCPRCALCPSALSTERSSIVAVGFQGDS